MCGNGNRLSTGLWSVGPIDIIDLQTRFLVVAPYLSPFVGIGELVLGSLHDVLIQGPWDTIPSKDISSSLRTAIGKVL